MRSFVLSFLLFVLPQKCGAEDGALLAGSARSPDGTALSQIVLSVTGPSGSQSLITGPGGNFHLVLPLGDYTIEARVPGLVLSPPARVKVSQGGTHLDLVLSPAPIREHVVVTATRGEAPASELGSSVLVVEGEDIRQRDPSSLIDLLGLLPGVSTTRTGGLGLEASAFLRGGESNFARILLDGTPVNEPGGVYNFGSLMPLEIDRIEIVEGAASSLYGTDALAGVVQLFTRQAGPAARPSVHAEAEGGNFSFWRGLVGTSGRAGLFDWNGGLERVSTDNQQPNSTFRETTGAASLGARLSGTTTLRFTLRGETSTVGTPGQTAFQRPDLDASYDWKSLTASGELRKTGSRLTQSLRLGYSLNDQLSRNPLDSGAYVPRYGDIVGAFSLSDFTDPKGYENNPRRLTAGYQAEVEVGRQHLLSLGADLEHETGSIGSLTTGPIDSARRTNVGVYVQDRAILGERLFVTLGGRVERNDSFGTRAVPRLAVAFRPFSEPNTTLHASAGLGIKEPTFPESFGSSFFALGNPNLKPERSQTVDFGVAERLFSDRLKVDVTGYYHEYRDQIAFTIVDPVTFQGSYINLGKTRARGIEASVEAVPWKWLRLAGDYTFLDGTILVSGDSFDPVYAAGQPLLRRPRHSGSLKARLETGRVFWSASLRLVGSRADSDFEGLGLTENVGYSRLDAQARVQVGHGFEAFVASENLLDKSYMEVLGYPALGRSVRAGLSFRSSGDR